MKEEILFVSQQDVTVTEMLGREKRQEDGTFLPSRRLDMFRVTGTKDAMTAVQKCGIFGIRPEKMLWEVPNRAEVIQCYRCQRFGHSARFCNMLQRCIKCSEHHQPGECQNSDKQTMAFCVNCGEPGHPANFRQCPKYLKAAQHVAERKAKNLLLSQERHQAARGLPPAMLVNSGLSFAAAAATKQHQQQQFQHPPFPR